MMERQLREMSDRVKGNEYQKKDLEKIQEILSDKWRKEHITTVNWYEDLLGDKQAEIDKFKQERVDSWVLGRENSNEADLEADTSKKGK